jgi:hypothetical protein
VLASGWVDHEAMAWLPTVRERPARVVYGPFAELAVVPDVVLLRSNGLGLMTLKNALPALRIGGKPQCHIIALAAEHGEVAASVGCALSRARTGMRADEMTCALPARRGSPSWLPPSRRPRSSTAPWRATPGATHSASRGPDGPVASATGVRRPSNEGPKRAEPTATPSCGRSWDYADGS